MASQTTSTTQYSPSPYLTVKEFRDSPTFLDSDSLLLDATGPEQDQALANVLARASSWIDSLCNQVLSATVDTEVGVLRPNRQGEIIVKTSCWPVTEVRAFSSGFSPQSLTPLGDLSGVFIEKSFFRVTAPGFLTSSAGPLQFGAWSSDTSLYCSWTYVNGWPNTTLATVAHAGDTSLVLVDTTGVYPAPPTRLTIYDGAAQERVVVTGVNGNEAELAAPIRSDHDPSNGDISVSALPPAVKQAAILIASALLKEPGDAAIVLESISSGGPRRVQAADADLGEDLIMADSLLVPYHRTS